MNFLWVSCAQNGLTNRRADLLPLGQNSMALKIQTNGSLLPSDLNLRAAQWNDVQPVAQLILDVCTADGDPTVAVTPEELERAWQGSDFNLEKDAWVVVTADGRIVGYEECSNRYAHLSLIGDGYVHPDFH